jgi:hypothetical protein
MSNVSQQFNEYRAAIHKSIAALQSQLADLIGWEHDAIQHLSKIVAFQQEHEALAASVLSAIDELKKISEQAEVTSIGDKIV